MFVLEIIVLLVFIGGLYIYGQISSKLDKIDQPVLDEEKILVNEDAPEMTGYTTYALFGIDHRDKNAALGGENSDTMIIASVNNDTKEVRLVSIYRDTLLNVGNDTYSKINSAYAYGGPEQAISALNTNLDLDITDYATVDFNALTAVWHNTASSSTTSMFQGGSTMSASGRVAFSRSIVMWNSVPLFSSL